MRKFLLLLLLPIFLVSCGEKAPTDISDEKKAILIPKAESFVASLSSGDYETCVAEFSSGLKTKIDEEKLKSMWENQVLPESGQFYEIKDMETGVQKKYNVIIVNSAHEFKNVSTNITFNKDDEISSVGFNFGENNFIYDEFTIEHNFKEESIVINPNGEMPLDGVLTLPNSINENIPVAIILADVGVTDKDETVSANKFSKNLAEQLANNGVASVRYNKKTYQYSKSYSVNDIREFTVYDEYIEDAISAKEVLSNDSRFNKDKIFLIGHGLGGSISPRIAETEDGFGGVVIMGGSPRTLWELSYDRYYNIISETKTKNKSKKAMIESIDTQFEIGKSLKGLTDNAAKDMLCFDFPGYYLKEMDEHPTRESIMQLNSKEIPVLIVQGDGDRQVFKDKDFAQFEEIASTLDFVNTKLYEGLNHGFGKYVPKSTIEEELAVQQNIEVEVINDIVKFTK